MKNINFYLLLFFLVTTVIGLQNTVKAQDYDFKVLVSKGTVELRNDNEWQTVKTGSNLKSGNEFRLAGNSYIGLIHKNGHPLELKDAGLYKVDDLIPTVNKEKSTLSKYTSFVLSSSEEQKANKLAATGAVHRGVDEIETYFPTNQSSIYNSKFYMRWNPSHGPFKVTFYNMFDDVLKEIETSECFLKVDLNDSVLLRQKLLVVRISSLSKPHLKSNNCIIKKLPSSEHEMITNSLADVNNYLKEKTPLKDLILPGFYESNNLYLDAIASYEELIESNPDETNTKSYDDFLIRNSFKPGKSNANN